jgi:lipopolysaccharide transport system ATP-binding protein
VSNPVIAIEALGKEYVIGGREGASDNFREMLISSLVAPFRRFSRLAGTPPANEEERFWALKDVSFQINEGEVVGIIGRNGAGKSTLLKILSRIVEPTEGRVTIRGRVASLLEVGTGFHPELTGRENIYLNGAILGMARAEIRRKFDEIVAFAEVEKFLDTPVKRYSSGMYVRLAFAVAAHLDPEILFVDEVLAVGDIQFQDKCLAKIEDTSRGGRTVLFVSHNLHAVARLCSRSVILKEGKVIFDGKPSIGIEQYLNISKSSIRRNVIKLPKSRVSEFCVDRIEILDQNRQPLDEIKTWDSVVFRIFFYSPSNFRNGAVELRISTPAGIPLIYCTTSPDNSVVCNFVQGENFIDCVFPRLTLAAGKYVLGAALAIPNIKWLHNALDEAEIEIHARDVYQSGFPPQASRYLIPTEHYWEQNGTA